VFSLHRFSILLLSLTSVWAADDTFLWEPAKVVAVEQVSTPAKTPDPSCRALPKGATPPPRCRESNLRAEQFWRVTVDTNNKRFVVRPYRAPNLLSALNQAGTDYVDPKLTVTSPVEVSVVSAKTIRIRTDQGEGIPALVDSQQLLSNPEAAPTAELAPRSSPPPPRPMARTSATPPAKVVALENSDFRELEVQELKSQNVSDGVVLYSFSGDSSPVRIASSTSVFLLLAESDAAIGGNPELSRLPVGKGSRQIVFSVAKNRSASSVPITVTQVSATVRKIRVTEALTAGEYVFLFENSNRGFLFEVR
jgi:hypothetical protein